MARKTKSAPRKIKKFPIYKINWSDFEKTFKYCCDKTSLHGFHYVMNYKLSLLARIFFAIACLSAIGFCFYLCNLQLKRYEQSQLSTDIQTTAYPIWEVAFPSVTLCNVNLVYRERLLEIAKVLEGHGISQSSFEDFAYNLTALITFTDLDYSEYSDIYEVLDRINYNSDTLMYELSQPCNLMIRECYWKSKKTRCEELFTKIKTPLGYCCAFNYLALTRGLDLNYKKVYTQGAGRDFGLELIVDVGVNSYVAPVAPYYGIYLFLQDTDEYVNIYNPADTIKPNEEVDLTLMPELIDSSPNVRSMPLHTRQCLYSDEVTMKWSDRYNYHTCITQCQAHVMHTVCDCSPFFYPRKSFRRVCSLKDSKCLNANKHKFSDLQYLFKLKEGQKSCICYPDCSDAIIYYINKNTQRYKNLLNHGSSNFSKVNVYYAVYGCQRIMREIKYTWDTVLASIGGIFGLCLGGSAISLAELLYYLIKGIFVKRDARMKAAAVNLPTIYTNEFCCNPMHTKRIMVYPTIKKNYAQVLVGNRLP